MLLMTEERPEPGTEPEPILTVEDVTKRLGVSRDTVTKLVRTGQLRTKRVGRLYRFREQWIQDFLNSIPPDTKEQP